MPKVFKSVLSVNNSSFLLCNFKQITQCLYKPIPKRRTILVVNNSGSTSLSFCLIELVKKFSHIKRLNFKHPSANKTKLTAAKALKALLIIGRSRALFYSMELHTFCTHERWWVWWVLCRRCCMSKLR